MKTPPPDKQPAAETLEEVAHKITAPFFDGSQLPTRFSAYRAILSALRNERERCQKVADEYVADMRSVTKRTEYGEGCLNAGVYIAARIRAGK